MKEQANFERHDVENTPFSIVKETNTGKCKITCGMQVMSEKEFESENEALAYIKTQPWELIVSIAALMSNNITNYIINQQKTQENGNS